MSLRPWLARRSLRILLVGGVAGACGAAQVPPGPDPEYQRPEVIPWEGGVAQADPLAGIEAGGEWVDEGPGQGGAPGTPEPLPAAPPAPSSKR
ncbi:MAG TPA: hypothetical protein VFU02_00245 [Polyangiaceae bacterium]|nr:hypothetical protein [Polyangiaceae bacterium]